MYTKYKTLNTQEEENNDTPPRTIQVEAPNKLIFYIMIF